MKKLISIIVVVCSMQFAANSQTTQDSLSINEAVLNYIEGWYSADTVRMKNSLYPELAKRGIVPSRDGKNTVMLKATFAQMVEWTSKSPNLMQENKVLKSDFKIKIIEMGLNIADVKCVSPQYVDYLHLARINNEWRILNAIWEPNYKEAELQK